eukprot:TRINITY_DN15661_c0_g1_i1.p1 TRINITY_DN15661_c0_g1~~TRINITY_DN15661_c0_g1_i1.p1  ORF type:complete len:207 (-),score=9.34 TRINITY_DN15661_c0_g1_i1:16-636(-)
MINPSVIGTWLRADRDGGPACGWIFQSSVSIEQLGRGIIQRLGPLPEEVGRWARFNHFIEAASIAHQLHYLETATLTTLVFRRLPGETYRDKLTAGLQGLNSMLTGSHYNQVVPRHVVELLRADSHCTDVELSVTYRRLDNSSSTIENVALLIANPSATTTQLSLLRAANSSLLNIRHFAALGAGQGNLNQEEDIHNAWLRDYNSK